MCVCGIHLRISSSNNYPLLKLVMRVKVFVLVNNFIIEGNLKLCREDFYFEGILYHGRIRAVIANFLRGMNLTTKYLMK